MKRTPVPKLFSFRAVALLLILSTSVLGQTQTQTTSTLDAIPTISLPRLDCLAATTCEEHIFEWSDPKCMGTTECSCVTRNSTKYIDCLKEKCPKNWKAINDADVKQCVETYGVDVSGNTTYTNAIVGPSATTYGGGFTYTPDGGGGLSQSDKIALGVGIGFGLPTLAVGLGAWLCVRRRSAKTAEKLTPAPAEKPTPASAPGRK